MSNENPKLKLSQRQEQVLSLAITGMSNKEIAKELGVETETVKTHVRWVIKKTGLRRAVWWKLKHQEGAAA